MSKETKTLEKKEEAIPVDLLEDVKIISAFSTVNYIQTKEKGIYVWLTPMNATYDDHFKMIDYIKEKTTEAKEIRKKQEEEAKKEEENKKIDVVD